MGMGGARAGGEAKSQPGTGQRLHRRRTRGQTALHRPWAQWAPRWSGREINVKHPTPPAASPLPALLHARPWACFERRRQGQGCVLVQAGPRVRYGTYPDAVVVHVVLCCAIRHQTCHPLLASAGLVARAVRTKVLCRHLIGTHHVEPFFSSSKSAVG
jgi:hypothetical protein